MYVVATAGHVDHGKSALLRALTGQEPDRLAEERRRGLSIELGYVWTRLPTVGDVAFVDVPGHERFISTMLSGVGSVPAVLLVVAADDPWMPQAAEHLAALDALGVERGLLVITRCDLADPEGARAGARRALADTSLRDVADVGVSAVTGIGLDVLRAQLVDMLTALPKPDGSADVRLWVDRVFTVRGAGTVVTGTLPAGTIEIGDELAIGGEQIRVRGLQTLGDDVDVVAGSARVAIRVGGASAELRRGVALTTPGAWLHTSVIDVRLRRPADTPPRRLTLHVGAASLSCEVRLLGPAAMGLLRLRLDRPVPLRVGDRCLLRDPGDRRVWGVRVLDPAPPALTRRGAALARAQELAATPDEPDLDDELRRRGVVTRSFLRQVGVPQRQLDAAPGVRDGWLLAKSTAAELRRRLCEEIARHDREVPLDPGLTPAMAAQRLGLPDHSALGSLIHPPVVMADGRLRLAGTGALPDDVQAAVTQLRALLHEDPFAAPDAAGLTALGLDTRRLAAAARAGELLRLADQVVLLPGADTMAVARLRDLPQPFTASEARQALGTSRRVVLPLLAHLDRLGATRRLSDDRRLLV